MCVCFSRLLNEKLTQKRPAKILVGLPKWLSGKESACQCRRHERPRFNPWVRKIPWRRKEQPSSVFWPGESHGHRACRRLQSMGSQRVRHNWATEHTTFSKEKKKGCAGPGNGNLQVSQHFQFSIRAEVSSVAGKAVARVWEPSSAPPSAPSIMSPIQPEYWCCLCWVLGEPLDNPVTV